MNYFSQTYRGIEIRLIKRNYEERKAMRFTLNNTNQNVWIPKKHLYADGTLMPEENIDYVFRSALNQLHLAGYTNPIIGIKRDTRNSKTKPLG